VFVPGQPVFGEWRFHLRTLSQTVPSVVSFQANFSEVSVYNGPRGSYFSSWGNTRAIFQHRYNIEILLLLLRFLARRNKSFKVVCQDRLGTKMMIKHLT
jgi:hypothetical protein